jgi:hypothetical protein
MKWFTTRFPQNLLLRNPARGLLAFYLILLVFALLYRPLDAHASRYFGYSITIVLYGIVAMVFMSMAVWMLKRMVGLPWTIGKELLSVMVVLLFFGVGIYAAGFLLEENPLERLTLQTFANSMWRSVLAGVLPLAMFVLLGYIEMVREQKAEEAGQQPREELLQISSQLKKEELAFYPSQFLYARADSNYVVFYLQKKSGVEKKMIRNSITSIGEQLSGVPHFTRVHRAYIVNVDKVKTKKGNSMGYKLTLEGVDEVIPVARNRTEVFDQIQSEEARSERAKKRRGEGA